MFNRLFVTLLIVAFVFSACQKEFTLEDGSSTTPGSGNFTARINDSSFSASITGATIQNGVIVVYGNRGGKSILMRVADSGLRNYQFTNTSFTNVAAYTDSNLTSNFGVVSFTTNGWPVNGNYGNLNVTRIDTAAKTISGTFALRVYRNVDSLNRNITQGVFTNIPYTTTAPPLTGSDTFRVKVNGVNFVYQLRVGLKAFGSVNISASASSGAPSVGLSLPDNVAPGTYLLDGGFTYIGQYNPSSTVFLASDSGRVTILSHDISNKRIRGNFNFLANTVFTNLPPNVQLTEGYFNMGYQ